MTVEEQERQQELEPEGTPEVEQERLAQGTQPATASESVAEDEGVRQEPAAKATFADSGEEEEPETARPERGAAPAEGRRRQFRRRRVCAFCVDGVTEIDYKDPMKFRRYISDRARIEPRRKTGTCAKHQRWLSVALKRARHLALLPYTPEHIRVTGVFAPRK